MKKLIPAVLAIALCATPATVHTAAQQVESGTVVTRDDVQIAYERYQNESDSVVIICPGFFNSKNNKWMRKVVELVPPAYDVIIFDFRGHGQSDGTFTWSAKEDKDVDAVIDRAKEYGYKRIGIIAFSLGAAAVVNDVARRTDVDSMVLISCPMSFKTINCHFWEPAMFADLKDNFACGWKCKGARTSSIFMPKENPIDTITRIKRTPILFIHGGKDWLVKDSHSRKLYAAAQGYKEIEIIQGGGHAERLIEFYEETMRKLIAVWFSKTLPRPDGKAGNGS